MFECLLPVGQGVPGDGGAVVYLFTGLQPRLHDECYGRRRAMDVNQYAHTITIP